jgi:hypothetical protein
MSENDGGGAENARESRVFQRQVIDNLDLHGDWELFWTAACLETLMYFLVDGEDVG